MWESCAQSYSRIKILIMWVVDLNYKNKTTAFLFKLKSFRFVSIVALYNKKRSSQSDWNVRLCTHTFHCGLFYRLQTMCNASARQMRQTCWYLCSMFVLKHPMNLLYSAGVAFNPFLFSAHAPPAQLSSCKGLEALSHKCTHTHTYIFIPLNCCWCVSAVCPGWCRCRGDAAGWSAGRFWGGTSPTRCAGKGPGRRCWRSSRPPTTTRTRTHTHTHRHFYQNCKRELWIRWSLRLNTDDETISSNI